MQAESIADTTSIEMLGEIRTELFFFGNQRRSAARTNKKIINKDFSFFLIIVSPISQEFFDFLG